MVVVEALLVREVPAQPLRGQLAVGMGDRAEHIVVIGEPGEGLGVILGAGGTDQAAVGQAELMEVEAAVLAELDHQHVARQAGAELVF